MTKLTDRLKHVTQALLNEETPRHSLRPEVLELVDILRAAQTTRPETHDDISGGETRTANGLALSPKMAEMCTDDYVRTIAFIRGAHDAIADIRLQHPDGPARILYIGSGPYATLAVPLMSIFAPTEAVFTILDIHSDSIASVQSIVTSLKLTGSVSSLKTMDAASYRADTETQPDIILIEILLACLKAEPQVAITRHLMSQVPNAILVPENISIDLSWVNPAQEFDHAADPTDNAVPQRDRIDLGSVFELNKQTIASWTDIKAPCLPARTVKAPDPLASNYQPQLFTKIQIYKNHILEDYDSGLTAPMPLSTDAEIQPGNEIKFHYELGPYPELVAEKVSVD